MAVVLFYDIIIFALFQTRNVGQLIKLQFFYKKNKNIFVVKSRDFVSADSFYLWKDKKREQLHRRIGKQKEILSSPVNICGLGKTDIVCFEMNKHYLTLSVQINCVKRKTFCQNETNSEIVQS